MRKPYRVARALFLLCLASPLGLAWLPADRLPLGLDPDFQALLQSSFRQLSITLAATLALATALTVALGYLSVLWQRFGRTGSSILKAVESVPAILVALFCYAPVSGYLARHSSETSQLVSLIVFILAATLTMLPESVRGVAIPLGDLYHRKYSLSFRSYGFTKRRILAVLMASQTMRGTLKRIAAGILLKTLVLDCSFGFIIQLGFGSYGTPAHASPGALIAANRDALFEGGTPLLFWLPSLLLVAISTSFLLTLADQVEAAA
jgi:ABC-type antimicrobial peptide transport system permease subunit